MFEYTKDQHSLYRILKITEFMAQIKITTCRNFSVYNVKTFQPIHDHEVSTLDRDQNGNKIKNYW